MDHWWIAERWQLEYNRKRASGRRKLEPYQHSHPVIVSGLGFPSMPHGNWPEKLPDMSQSVHD